MDWNLAIEMWMDYLVGNGRQDATVVKYGGLLRRLATWWKGKGRHKPSSPEPLQATPQDLEMAVGPLAHAHGLTATSRRPLVAAVRMFYQWAHRMELIETNPARNLQYPEAAPPLPIPMGLRNLEKLLSQPDIETLGGLRDAAMLAVLAGCGLRIGGLCAMNQEDLYWPTDDRGRERLVVKVTEKGRRQRLVPAPRECGLLVRAYLGHPEIEAIDRNLPGGGRVLWVSLRNRRVPDHQYHGEKRRLTGRSVRQILVDYGARAGIPRDELHPHALRHTYGTELAEADIDAIRGKALMGQRSDAAHEIYRHLAMNKLTEAVDQANPLRRIRAPILERVRQLERELDRGD